MVCAKGQRGTRLFDCSGFAVAQGLLRCGCSSRAPRAAVKVHTAHIADDQGDRGELPAHATARQMYVMLVRKMLAEQVHA